MKMSELLQLNQLQQNITNKKMPIKITYKFTRHFKEVQEQVDFFNNTVQNLINQYGKKDENGDFILTENKNGVMIQEDKFNECMNKIDELNDLDIELTYNPTFTIEELDGLDLTISELNSLMPFIVES